MADKAITKVFISYSRRDREVVARLVDALEGADDIDVFRDTEDILPTEEWKGRLEELIAQADTIVFALSPHSAASEVCAWEVEYAEGLNKRVAPVVIEEVAPEAIPAPLTKYNYIFFTQPGEFDTALGNLIVALNTDIDWIREHTRLGELAGRWDRQRQIGARYLRGQELADAESWLAAQPPNAPGPTNVHHEFILESRRAATRRQRMWIGGSLAAMIVTSVLSIFAFLQMLEADDQRAEAEQQRGIAEEQRTQAEEQRAIAVENEQLAQENAEIAQAQRDIAEEQRQIADEQRAAAESNAALAEANEQLANRERDEAERARAIAEYRAALLSAGEAKSLAGNGEVNEALLLLLESATSLEAESVPESVLIAFNRVLEHAQGQSIVAIPPDGTAVSVGDVVYYHDPASGELLRYDVEAGLGPVAALDTPAVAIAPAGDGTGLVIVGGDRTVSTLDPVTGARQPLGSFNPITDPQERAYDREDIRIWPDGTIIWQAEYSIGGEIFGLSVHVMDTSTGEVRNWDLLSESILGYVVLPDGTRYLAPSSQMQTEAFAYRLDLAASGLAPLDLETSPELPQNLTAMACLGDVRPGDEELVAEIARRFEEDFPFGMVCERFGKHMLITEQFWSSGGGYSEYRVLRPEGELIDAIALLRDFAQVPEVVDNLAWAAVGAETGKIALIYGRDLYVFDEYGISLSATLPYPPEFAQFVSPTEIAVLQPLLGEIRLFEVSDEPAAIPGASSMPVSEDFDASRRHIGNCAGFSSDWAFGTLRFSNDDSVSFEGQIDAAPQMVISTANGSQRIDFPADYSLCVQFTRDLRRLLVKSESNATIYDFDEVRRTGALDGTALGEIADPTLQSAFLIGDTTDVLTGHSDQRILRWTRTEDDGGWTGQEVYRGTAPIVYAEPDDAANRLLIVEAIGQSYFHTIYYSLAAGEAWFDLGTAYKYITVAFTDGLAIDYYGHLNIDRQLLTPLDLGGLVDAAGAALSPHCAPVVETDYSTSPCWPMSLGQ
jgi:hypothetical protein